MVRKKRPATSTAILLAAGCWLSAGVTVAAPRVEDAHAMPLGAAAPAPEGFIDLCRRAPSQCPAIGPAPDLDRLAVQSNRLRWAALFGMSPAPVPGPSAAPHPAGSLLSNAPLTPLVPRLLPVYAASAAAGTSRAPTGAPSVEDLATAEIETVGTALAIDVVPATDFASVAVAEGDAYAPPVKAADQPENEAVRFALDREGWRLVNRINRSLNREIRHVEDRDLYGRPDLWTLPVASRGDCEDYVLAKRQALIHAGVPAQALSIAIVETRWGETHAVLLLASDRGEYVLDSLSPWVTRWDQVDYRWRERQARGGTFDWVSVAL
ncbi:transglutaminase-like cysteine peptidase [Brevundimonas bacteroides]|uniref:transglutaminase-like cysteine peptidase n=1 Tax=Brevundimonas bacteroides TaxID=74311 RepID=UPI000A074488|nr:transglutaminase-like cysteine peptidase [Brevundimonas bacteroides]